LPIFPQIRPELTDPYAVEDYREPLFDFPQQELDPDEMDRRIAAYDNPDIKFR
jgi:hypothetical protein